MNTDPKIQMVSIELIIPNRFQPRLTFDDQSLNELSASIKEHGIIQPLVLRRLGDKYEIIAGERRYKAATIAGLTEVPAIISNLDDNQSAEVALVENVQRRNLTSIEEAKSYKKILEKGYLTQDQLAKRMGITQSTIANKLRLLNLTDDVQESLLNERISERHARSLLQLTNGEEQKAMLNRVIKERMTVKQLDSAIKEKLNIASDVLMNEPLNQLEVENIAKPDLEIEKESNQINEDLLGSNENLKENLSFEDKEFETLDLSLPFEPNIEEIKTNAEDIISKDSKKLFNIFDQPEYMSLEDEKVNLSVGDNIFDNTSEETLEKEEEKNTLEIPEFNPTAPIIIEKTLENNNTIKENNLPTVVSSYHNLEEEIKAAGYKITTEEFDFEDLYQIIIKIEKQVD